MQETQIESISSTGEGEGSLAHPDNALQEDLERESVAQFLRVRAVVELRHQLLGDLELVVGCLQLVGFHTVLLQARQNLMQRKS